MDENAGECLTKTMRQEKIKKRSHYGYAFVMSARQSESLKTNHPPAPYLA
jgi:hypothetical protein